MRLAVTAHAVHVLVAAPGEIDHHEMIARLLRRKFDRLGNRMRRLERWNDAFKTTAQLKRCELFPSENNDSIFRLLKRPGFGGVVC